MQVLRLDVDLVRRLGELEVRHGLLAIPERLAGAVFETVVLAVLHPNHARGQYGEADVLAGDHGSGFGARGKFGGNCDLGHVSPQVCYGDASLIVSAACRAAPAQGWLRNAAS